MTSTFIPAPRVIVDPNGFSRLNPDWSTAMFSDADRVPTQGQRVVAVQPYDDEPDYVGTATVVRVDHERELLYLLVDWSSFHDEHPVPAADARSERSLPSVDVDAVFPGVNVISIFPGPLTARAPSVSARRRRRQVVPPHPGGSRYAPDEWGFRVQDGFLDPHGGRQLGSVSA